MKKEIVIILLLCFEILNSEAALSTVTPTLEDYGIKKVVLKTELKVAAPADQVWGVYSSPSLPSLIMDLLPGTFEKMDVVYGDGGVGTILHLVYPPGQIPHEYYEKFVVIDNWRRLKKVRQIEGGYLDMGVTYYVDIFHVVPTGSNSCVIKSYIVYNVKRECAEEVEPYISIEGSAAMAEAIAKYVLGGVSEI